MEFMSRFFVVLPFSPWYSLHNISVFQKVNPQTAEAIDHFLLKLKAYANAESPFTLILDDPAGNSFIENP